MLERYHSEMFTGAQPGVPDVASVQARGAPSPLSTQEWRPSHIPILQKHGAQADTCQRTAQGSICWRPSSRPGAHMRVCPLPHPLHLCQAQPRSTGTNPCTAPRSSPGRATQHAQVHVFQGEPPAACQAPHAVVQHCDAQPPLALAEKPHPGAKYLSVQRPCAAEQPGMHSGQLIVSGGLPISHQAQTWSPQP